MNSGSNPIGAECFRKEPGNTGSGLGGRVEQVALVLYVDARPPLALLLQCDAQRVQFAGLALVVECLGHQVRYFPATVLP